MVLERDVNEYIVTNDMITTENSLGGSTSSTATTSYRARGHEKLILLPQ